MSDAEDTQADSTWPTLQTSTTPWTPMELPQEDHLTTRDSVDRDLVVRDAVGETIAVPLMSSCEVGETTMLPSGSSVEDPVVLDEGLERKTDDTHQKVEDTVVLDGGLEGKTDGTPRRSHVVSLGDLEGTFNRTPQQYGIERVRNLEENTIVIPRSMMEEDLRDPRVSSSPTTSTPGNTPTSSGTSELKESELQNSDQSAIEISGILAEEKRKEEVDDKIIINMMDISLAGNSGDEDESHDADDDTLWEATDEDISLLKSGAKSCIAKRTRSHKSLREMNLTELAEDWSLTTLEDSFVVLETNAVDSMNLHKAEKAGLAWDNKEEWYKELQLLDTSLNKADKTGGPRRQLEMIKVCNRKANEIAKKNEEMRGTGGRVMDNPNREGENKKVTFVIEDAAYTTAIKEVVKALETLLSMNLYAAPMKNVENIIKIILSICLDYSNQVQMVQETMESMARLIKELLILKGKMVNVEKDNAELKVEKAAALLKIDDLNKLSDISYTFSRSLVGGTGGRDLVAEITTLKHQNSGLRETARQQELTYKENFKRRELYKEQVKDLNKTILNMEKGRKAEREKDKGLIQHKETQLGEMTTRYEHEQEKVSHLEACMEGMKITHKKDMGTYVEEQFVLSEKVNADKLIADMKIMDLEDQLKKVRKDLEDQLKRVRWDLNAKLRNKDEDLASKDAEIKESKEALAKREKVIKDLKEELKTQEQVTGKTKKELRFFKLQCRMFGCNDNNAVLDPLQPERSTKTPIEEDDGMGSEINTTSENSYVDLHSSTAGNWGDTSNLDTTCGQYSKTSETLTTKQKGEKRKRMEVKETQNTEKAGEAEKSEISSEESSTSHRSDNNKEPSKRKRQSRAKGSVKGAIQKDQNKLVDELKEEHQKKLDEQKRLHQNELDVLREKLEQMRCQEEGVRQPKEVGGAVGGVQDPKVSSQKPREAAALPNQNRQVGSPLIVAITDENKSQVSSQFKGLIVNPDGTISMTLQFTTWSNNQEVQMEKLFKVAPPHPENINNDGHPMPTRKNIVWTHDGDWVDVPYSVNDKGPNFKSTLVARIERSINTDGVIERSLSYGDDETKLKVWYSLTEMLAAFPHWDVPSPSLYFNTKKFNPNRKKPKEESKPPRGRGKFQGSRGRGRGGYGRYGDQYQEWDRQQGGGGGDSQDMSYDQGSWNQNQQPRQQQQQQQQQYHQQQGPVPPPVMHQNPNAQQHYQQQVPAVTHATHGQQYHQYPTQAPAHNQQLYNPAPIPAPGPPAHYQYHHPSPMISDQYQYQYSEGGVRPKDQQSHSRSHRESPREYPRERRPHRSSRDRQRRDSRDRGSRRYPSQESDYKDSQQEYSTREYERRRRDDSQERSRNSSRDRKPRNRSKSNSTKRRSERTPSPTNSGIGRGGGRKDKDQGSRHEEGRGRGRSNQDKRESDASYGES